MNPYPALAVLLGDSPEVSVPLGAIGGAGSGWTRYATIRPNGGNLVVSIYRHPVAEVRPDGSMELRTCGYYTASTRAALALAVTGFPCNNYTVSMRTPGSRGGTPGPWRAEVRHNGTMTEVGDDWTAIGAEVAA